MKNKKWDIKSWLTGQKKEEAWNEAASIEKMTALEKEHNDMIDQYADSVSAEDHKTVTDALSKAEGELKTAQELATTNENLYTEMKAKFTTSEGELKEANDRIEELEANPEDETDKGEGDSGKGKKKAYVSKATKAATEKAKTEY